MTQSGGGGRISAWGQGGDARLSRDALSSTDQEPLGFTAQEQQDLACASKGEGFGGNYYLPAMTGWHPSCVPSAWAAVMNTQPAPHLARPHGFRVHSGQS